MKHPPTRQLSQRERTDTTQPSHPHESQDSLPDLQLASTRSCQERPKASHQGMRGAPSTPGLQVNLIVSAIEPLHRLLMFLRQFLPRISEELLKAKHLSESAKPWTELQRHTTCTKWIGDVVESQTNPPKASSLWIELHRHTVLHKVDLNTHNHQRLCSRIADPKNQEQEALSAQIKGRSNTSSWSA